MSNLGQAFSQLEKGDKQLIVSPGPPLIIEEAEILRLEIARDADDELVKVEALEDDELESERSHLDDVPLHLKRSRTGSLPQIRDQPMGTDGTRSVPGDGAHSRWRWKIFLGRFAHLWSVSFDVS